MGLGKRRLNLFWVACVLLAFACVAGATVGRRVSVEAGVGTGGNMLFLAAWGGTAYLAAEGENGRLWFELKRSDRPPMGTGWLGFRRQWDGRKESYSVGVPLWLMAALLLAVARGSWERHSMAPPGLCPSCGYDIRASPGRCPECGTAAAHG